MFGLPGFGRGSNEPLTPAPAPAPAQTPAPAPAPTGGQPAPSPAPAPQPTPAPAPAPTPVNPMANLLQSLAPAPTGGPQPNDPGAFALQFIDALSAQPAHTPSMAPHIDPVMLRQAFESVDLTSGVDLGQIMPQLQGNDQAVPADQAMRALLQVQGLNIISAMAPLINQMVAAGIERASQDSVTRINHQHASQALVTDFVKQRPHLNNPLSLQILSNVASTIVAANPQGANPATVHAALERFMNGLAASTSVPAVTPNDAPAGAQVNFSGLFAR